MPGLGKFSKFSNPQLAGIRQYSINGFRLYLIFYLVIDSGIEILRVLHGARDLEAILDEQ